MELLETIVIFDRWYCVFFKCSIDDFVISWDYYDVYIFSCNCIYYCEKNDFWRSGKRMAIFGVHYYFCGWNPNILYGNHEAVFIKDLYGSKKKAALCDLLHE